MSLQFYKKWESLFYNKGCLKQELFSSSSWSSVADEKEGLLNALQYPGLDLKTEKKDLGSKIDEVEVWNLVNSNVSMLVSWFWQMYHVHISVNLGENWVEVNKNSLSCLRKLFVNLKLLKKKKKLNNQS